LIKSQEKIVTVIREYLRKSEKSFTKNLRSYNESIKGPTATNEVVK